MYRITPRVTSLLGEKTTMTMETVEKLVRAKVETAMGDDGGNSPATLTNIETILLLRSNLLFPYIM
jgi:hypothetical protein